MKVILFDEHEDIAKKLENVLKEKYSDIRVCTNLFSFLESFSDDADDFLSRLLILSESVLKSRNMTIDYLLKNFDYYAPIITYSVTDMCLNLDINYIYEYMRKNNQTFAKYVYDIQLCFYKFANNKEYFSLNNFYCREVPTYLSLSRKKQVHCNLYEIVTANENSSTTFNLTKMQAKLFAFLISHKDGASLNDILYNLWGSVDKSKAQNVYTLIHKLNSVIMQKTNNKYQIIHQGKKYRLLQTTKKSVNFDMNNIDVG